MQRDFTSGTYVGAGSSPARSTRSYWRSLAVIGLTVPVMLLIDYGVSYATVAALFSGSIALVIGTVVIGFMVLVALIVIVSRVFTGKLAVPGAAAVAILLTWAGAFGFLNGVLRPLALREDALLHVAVCGMAALALGLFLGPWPLRVTGGDC